MAVALSPAFPLRLLSPLCARECCLWRRLTGPCAGRPESVHYLGYFSSHEQFMQSALVEEVKRVRHRILEVVERAKVHCRSVSRALRASGHHQLTRRSRTDTGRRRSARAEQGQRAG